jgi:hypothetical protein
MAVAPIGSQDPIVTHLQFQEVAIALALRLSQGFHREIQPLLQQSGV